MTHKHSKHPEQSLRVFPNRELLTDDRSAELNRKPLVEAKDVPKHLNLDPEKVALGNLVAGMMIPSKEDVLEAVEHPVQRAARVKDSAIYVFDEGTPTGRHARKDQPRYTVVGANGLDQIAAEADDGYQARHAEAPKGYVGRHAGGAMGKLLGRLRNMTHRKRTMGHAPEAPRHPAPIVQLGKGDSLSIGREHWVPSASLDVVNNDPELSEHYERTGRHQGEFTVDQAGTFTYKDLGRNGTLLYYRERTPNEEEKFEERKRIHRDRIASLHQSRRVLAQEMAARGERPYPPHEDVYVGRELAEARRAEERPLPIPAPVAEHQGPPTQALGIEDRPTNMVRY
jgi:hypothetical protein